MIIFPCRNPETALSFLFNILIYPFELIFKVFPQDRAAEQRVRWEHKVPSTGTSLLCRAPVSCAGDRLSRALSLLLLPSGKRKEGGGGKEHTQDTCFTL